MSPHDARLVPAAGAAWLASADAVLRWGWWPLVGVLAILVAGCGWRSARPALAVAAAAGAAGMVAGLLVVGAAAPVRAAVGHEAVIDAVAAGDAAQGTGGATAGLWRVEVTVVRVDGAAARARVVVWGGDDWRGVVRGQRLSLRSRLAAADGVEGGLAWRPQLVAAAAPVGVDAAVASLRAALRDATADLPVRVRALTRGMVIGDDSGMTPSQRAQMASAGLSHLTAVSGSHFAIVLAAVTAALRVVVRSRRIVAAVTGVAMGALVCLVFPEPSVARATTMAAAVCAALWWGRPAQALPALSAGVVAVAVLDPPLACEPGFAMSVAAVAAIALWAPALAARIERHVPTVLAHPMAVCITAQAAVLPLLALIGGGASVWSVAANLAVGWCATPVTLIGLAAVVAGCVCPSLAHALAHLAGASAWPVDAAARAAAVLPGAGVTVPPGAWGAAASGIAISVVVALTFARRLRLPVVAGIGVVVALAVPLAPRLVAPAIPGDWLVVACDVGQGDAMLLRSGPHAAVVIDVGPQDGPGPACLHRYGVAAIDLLIITHPHADHEGALPDVLRDVPVASAWISPAESEDPTVATRALSAAGVPTTVVHAGTQASVGAVRVVVLAPDDDRVGEGSTGLNDASIVTMSTVSGVTVLGLGDLEHHGQQDLARRIGPVVVDVVKVPHHGSDRQEEALARIVNARVAVVSVGAGNVYGHPSPDAITLWGSRAGAILRTDHCGDVVIARGPALATPCSSDVAG